MPLICKYQGYFCVRDPGLDQYLCVCVSVGGGGGSLTCILKQNSQKYEIASNYLLKTSTKLKSRKKHEGVRLRFCYPFLLVTEF
jgi:hypothetical protein